MTQQEPSFPFDVSDAEQTHSKPGQIVFIIHLGLAVGAPYGDEVTFARRSAVKRWELLSDVGVFSELRHHLVDSDSIYLRRCGQLLYVG